MAERWGGYPWYRDTLDTAGINLFGGVEPRVVAWLVIGTSAVGLAVSGAMIALGRSPGRALGLCVPAMRTR